MFCVKEKKASPFFKGRGGAGLALLCSLTASLRKPFPVARYDAAKKQQGDVLRQKKKAPPFSKGRGQRGGNINIGGRIGLAMLANRFSPQALSCGPL